MTDLNLTHEEACRLVEDAYGRVASTLAYIRAKLNNPFNKPGNITIQDAVDSANLMCNINVYGAYLKGAKAMYRALSHHYLLDIPRDKNFTCVGKSAKETKIINKSMIDLYMSSSRNLEWLLTGLPLGVEVYTEIDRDKKGRIVGAKSKFVTKETKLKEL